jgi:hypothetical protein
VATIGPEKLIKSFRKHEKVILDYCRTRIDDYHGSKCYSILKNRCKRLDNSIDLKSGKEKNQWNSRIQIPYGHESYVMTAATLTRNFNPDPLISVEPMGDTPYENAQDATETLSQNQRSTHFRDRAFRDLKKMVTRYGSAPVVSYFEHRPQKTKRTAWGPMGFEQFPTVVQRQNVYHDVLHPLNYFQDHDYADPEASDFQGWLQRWYVSKLMGLVKGNEDVYIKSNLKAALAQIKDGILEHPKYHTVNPQDFHHFMVDVEHIFTKLNFEGNEDDDTTYYLEIVGDKIIRFQDNPHDFDIKPVEIVGLDRRLEYWWSNTPVEKTFSIENYANITMNMLADSIWRANQSWKIYPQGKIDPATLNDRHKNGGWVGIDPAIFREFKVPFHHVQHQELSPQAIQYMMGEAKEALQRTQSKPDVQREGVQGGPQNNTATAYQGMQAEADMLQYDYLSEFASGLKGIGRHTIIMLQQRLNDWFSIRPNPKEAARELHKSNILGEFAYQVKTSLTKNTVTELMKYQNALTWVINMQGTGHPDFQRVNVPVLFKQVLQKFDLDTDMDELYPEQPAAQMPGQGMGQPGIAANAGRAITALET